MVTDVHRHVYCAYRSDEIVLKHKICIFGLLLDFLLRNVMKPAMLPFDITRCSITACCMYDDTKKLWESSSSSRSDKFCVIEGIEKQLAGNGIFLWLETPMVIPPGFWRVYRLCVYVIRLRWIWGLCSIKCWNTVLVQETLSAIWKYVVSTAKAYSYL